MDDITTIQVSKKTALRLQKKKETLSDSYETIIRRLLDFYETRTEDQE